MKRFKNSPVKNLTKKILLLLGIIFLVNFSQPSKAKAAGATLSVIPSANSYQVNQNFTVEIRVNTGSDSINTVTANLVFPTDKLKIVSTNITNSFATIWFENNITNASGEVRLTGSVPTPGVSGSNLLLATLNIQALATTTANNPATLNFETSSAVYRNNDNSNILASQNGGQFSLSQTSDAAASPTPAPSVTPTPNQSITPTVTRAPKPGSLPYVGSNDPTILLFLLGFFLIVGGIILI